MQLLKRLDGFEIKLRQLASKIERQEAEREALRAENDKLKKELDHQRGTISTLREKLEQTAARPAGEPDPENPAALRNQLDHCLRELDACIEWLENH